MSVNWRRVPVLKRIYEAGHRDGAATAALSTKILGLIVRDMGEPLQADASAMQSFDGELVIERDGPLVTVRVEP